MSFEAALLVAVSTLAGVTTILAGVIAVLWRKDTSATAALTKYFKQELTDAIARIRRLEDGRLADSVVHAHDIKALFERLMVSQASSTHVHQRVCDAMNSLTEALASSPCLRDFKPTDVRPGTEPITQKEKKA